MGWDKGGPIYIPFDALNFNSILLSECITSAVDVFSDYSEITLLVEIVHC